MMAANSRSLFVMVPFGLAAVINWDWMSVSKAVRQRTGMCCGVWGEGCNQNPPIPTRDASVAVTMSGARGTNAWIGTGYLVMVSASTSQSCNMALSKAVSVIRLCLADWKACCRIEKRCSPPYKAVVALRIVPSKARHFLSVVRR